jgi:hypothetical protein
VRSIRKARSRRALPAEQTGLHIKTPTQPQPGALRCSNSPALRNSKNQRKRRWTASTSGRVKKRKDQRRVGQEPPAAQGNEQGAVDQHGAQQGANAKPNGSNTEHAAQGGGSYGASVKLSEEQRTRIQRIIVHNKNVARVDKPDFSVTLGARIPKDVHITVLPEEIVSIVPEYRSFDYILVGDEILIIDPVSLEIVDIIPA